MYIHPKSLAKPINRIYLNTAKQLGAKIKITTYGKTQEKLIKAVISIEGDKQLIRALNKLGIKTTRKPIPALYSLKVLAEIAYKMRNPIPIGVGAHKQIVFVDSSYPIATTKKEFGVAIPREPVLWIDYMGNGSPPSYREYTGLPIPTSPTKRHQIAERIAKLLRTRKDAVLASLSSGEYMEDEEVTMDVLRDFKSWKVFSDDEEFGRRNYIDFSGLPRTLQIGLLIVASMFDGWLIVDAPRAWKWIEEILRYRANTLVLCPNAMGFNFPSIITEGKLIRKINFMTLIVVTEEITPFWDIK